MGLLIIIVIKLPSFKDEEIGNLRKFEYFTFLKDFHYFKEIKFN